MTKTNKRKLNLARETLVELKPDVLDGVLGGEATNPGMSGGVACPTGQIKTVLCGA